MLLINREPGIDDDIDSQTPATDACSGEGSQLRRSQSSGETTCHASDFSGVSHDAVISLMGVRGREPGLERHSISSASSQSGNLAIQADGLSGGGQAGPVHGQTLPPDCGQRQSAVLQNGRVRHNAGPNGRPAPGADRQSDATAGTALVAGRQAVVPGFVYDKNKLFFRTADNKMLAINNVTVPASSTSSSLPHFVTFVTPQSASQQASATASPAPSQTAPETQQARRALRPIQPAQVPVVSSEASDQLPPVKRTGTHLRPPDQPSKQAKVVTQAAVASRGRQVNDAILMPPPSYQPSVVISQHERELADRAVAKNKRQEIFRSMTAIAQLPLYEKIPSVAYKLAHIRLMYNTLCRYTEQKVEKFCFPKDSPNNDFNLTARAADAAAPKKRLEMEQLLKDWFERLDADALRFYRKKVDTMISDLFPLYD